MKTCVVCGKEFEHWCDDVCSTECSNQLEH